MASFTSNRNDNKSIVKVDYLILKKLIDKGYKRADLAKYYNLPESNIAKILKECGLKIRKFHKKKYEIINFEPKILDSELLEIDDPELIWD